jgi:hypothetical protein
MANPKKTRPSDATREEEERDARVKAGSDRMPTADEEALADEIELDPEAPAHYQEMAERGAKQRGEGRIE